MKFTIYDLRFAIWKRASAALLALIVGSSATPATQVVLPLASMFGGGYAGQVQISAQSPLITDGTNVYVGTFTNFTAVPGVNPTNSLTPNNYVITFTDIPKPWRITVPNTNVVLNALTLTAGALTTFNYVPPFTNNYTATNVNNATGANVNLSGTFSGTLNAPYIGNTNSYGVGFTGNGSVGGVIYDSYISPSWQLSGNPSYSSYVNLLGQGFGIGTASPNPAHGVDIVGTAYSTSFATTGTTNQILFGATNTPPTSTNIIAWISVQVSGLTNKFRLGLCQ